MKPAAQGVARLWFFPPALIVGLTLLLLVVIPSAFDFPVPDDAVQLRDAQFQSPGRASQTVDLPHRWPPEIGPGPVRVRYVLPVPDLTLGEPHVLLVPAARPALTLLIDGQILHRDTPPQTQDAAGSAVMVKLPEDLSGAGHSLEIVMDRQWGVARGYLSPVYVVAEDSLGDIRWLWAMGDGVLSTIALAVHALIVFALAIVWTARRRDPIFGWLLLLGLGSLLNVLLTSPMAPGWLSWAQPYGVLVASGLGLGMAGLALAIVGIRRPLWLKAGVAGLPAALILLAVLDVMPAPVPVVVTMVTVIGGNLAGGLLLLRGGMRPTDWDRLFLATPFLLAACFTLRDTAVALGLIDGAFLLSYHVRTLTIVAVLALLMRQLARAMNALDAANERQRLRLEEQEAELSLLHHEQQKQMAQAAREEERQRLMRDLHDGLSGHLVSIIALSEKDAPGRSPVEKAARAALEDLRLVINSLDLEDGDLRLALAGFRERLVPQLRRLGVALDWSMEDLPEIGGVTPGNALSILRILQEAVTNALKHGPARHILIRGAPNGDGGAVVTVRNDTGALTSQGAGRGLENMRQRADRLGGGIRLERAADHAVLTLILPPLLAEG